MASLHTEDIKMEEATTTVFFSKIKLKEDESLCSGEDKSCVPNKPRDLEFIAVKTEPECESEGWSEQHCEFGSSLHYEVKQEEDTEAKHVQDQDQEILFAPCDAESESSRSEAGLEGSEINEPAVLERYGEYHTVIEHGAEDELGTGADTKEIDETLIRSEKSNNFVCKICFKSYTRKWYFKQHMEAAHTESVYKCETCGRVFERRKSLIVHHRIHLQIRHPCTICDKQFSKKADLKNHIRTHSGEYFKCSLCCRSYTHRSNYHLHMKKHAGFQYCCKICSKSYAQKWMLNDHLRSHDGEMYDCAHCGKTFTFKQQLRRHITIHILNENHVKHTCHVCDKGFTEKCNLKQHMKIHSGKRYLCTLCEKSYSTNGGLQRHFGIHHCTPASSKIF